MGVIDRGNGSYVGHRSTNDENAVLFLRFKYMTSLYSINIITELESMLKDIFLCDSDLNIRYTNN